LEELEPAVIDLIARQAVEHLSEQSALRQLVESIVKKELAPHLAWPSHMEAPTMVGAPAKSEDTIASAIEAGRKAYQEEKRKTELAGLKSGPQPRLPGEPPIEIHGEEEQRLHNDARRFARLLVSEISIYNKDRLREGLERSDIYGRLSEDIDRSRQMYSKRVSPSVARTYDYFHHTLIKNLAKGDVTNMGKEYPGELLKS
jgi:hypothetical protein